MKLPFAHLVLLVFLSGLFTRAAEDRLPNTALLTTPGDLASNLVAGVDRFLLNQIATSEDRRERHWKRDFSSPAAYDASVRTNRARLARILGVRDRPESGDADRPAMQREFLYSTESFHVYSYSVRAFADVTSEGLILFPFHKGDPHNAFPTVIAIPDADESPELIAGLPCGRQALPAHSQFARALAVAGCAVVIPAIIDREVTQRRNAKLTNREFLYRSAFELGRHPIGYEVQKIFGIIRGLGDWHSGRLGIFGHGEGGLIALCAAALDPGINYTVVSGYFGDRRHVWQEPIDRNVFGLLEEFGDAEIASLVAPRRLIVEAARGPETAIAGQGGAPGHLRTPDLASVRREFARAQQFTAKLNPPPVLSLVVSGEGNGAVGANETIQPMLRALVAGLDYPTQPKPENQARDLTRESKARMARQIHEIDRHNQWLLTESPYTRQEFMKNLDTSSPEKYAETSARYRELFYQKAIGRFDLPLLPMNPHSRLAYDTPLWTGYEVTLDVFQDVMAYGILLVPKNIQPGEKRPVVVCQHGLEGRPQDLVTGDSQYYHDFAAKLAERGFITFAPQNLYIFEDRFRTLQRKANPLGKTLFSIITPQHQQILNWLKTLPNVDPKRIAFYGLSYGGKTAMRVPALLTDYCLSICSADFNDWVWKNASTRSPYSYVWTGEYEIFEFDLGSTFNYAEMAALIAPRPFMVERGHFDGVAPDETVAYEFAKVKNLYDARLKLPADRAQIEFFVGPHTINGKGTFDFLHHHLNWLKPAAKP